MVIKKAVKMKIFLSYILISIILLLIFAGIVNYVFYIRTKEQTRELSSKNLDNMVNASELMISSLYNYLYEIFLRDEHVTNALYLSEFNRLEMYNIHERLREIVRSNSILDSIYIYNKKNNIIFSNISTFKTVDDFYEEGIIKLIENYLQMDIDIFVPRKKNIKNFGKNKTENEIITFIFTNAKRASDIKEAMVVNISEVQLRKIINQHLIVENTETFIINNQKQIISHPNPKMFNTYINEELYKKIEEDDIIKGTFTTYLNKDEKIVNFDKNLQWGLTFISTASYNDLLSKNINIHSILLLITIIFVVIALLGIIYFTRVIYTPLDNIIKNISRMDFALDMDYNSEYNFVSASLNNMYSMIADLQHKVINYFPAKRNITIKNLLNGDKKFDINHDKTLESKNINLKGPVFLVLIMKIDSFLKLSKDKSIKDLEIYHSFLIDSFSKYFFNKFLIEFVDDQIESIPIIINLNNDNSLDEVIERINKVQQDFNSKYNLTFTVGIGRYAYSINDLYKSYSDALEFINYSLIFGKNSVISEEDINKLNRLEYQYPYKIEKKILEQIKLAEQEELNALLNKFINKVKYFEYEEIILSFSQLILMITRIGKRMTNSSPTNNNIWNSYFEIENQLKYCYTFADIKEIILSISDKIIKQREKIVNDKSIALINKINSHIDKSFSDASLSIEKLADMVDLSPNYLRNLYKEITGNSLSNYIRNKRFEEAKKLLVKTDYTAKKIAFLVGFQNSDYFYNAFKKYIGKSASNYRREAKSKKQNE